MTATAYAHPPVTRPVLAATARAIYIADNPAEAESAGLVWDFAVATNSQDPTILAYWTRASAAIQGYLNAVAKESK